MRAALAAAAVLGSVDGCYVDDGDAAVAGVVMLGEADPSDYGEVVLIRAVPDHPDGFSPTRPYRGGRVLEASCPLQHTDFPADFLMFEDEAIVDGAPPRWVLLAWIGNHDRETWVSPGQLYGTATFEFDRDAYGAWAQDVVVELDTEAP